VETLSSEMGFVTLKGSIYIEFVFKDPFTTNNGCTGRKVSDGPSIICNKSIILHLHCTKPRRIRNNCLIIVGVVEIGEAKRLKNFGLKIPAFA